MTATMTCLLEGKDAENSQHTQYTSPAGGLGTIIDKFTATNHSAGAAVFSVNLVASGGSAASTNLVISAKSLAAGETYTCPEVVSHVLKKGDFISTLCDTAAAVAIRASGRELT